MGKFTVAHGSEAAREVGRYVLRSYTRVFDHADTDVALEATSAEIALGDALPTGAVVYGVTCDVTEDWSDGSTGTFDLDVGDGTDDDLFTPTQVVLDGGAALRTQAVIIPASGVQLTVTIVSSVDLDTATGGTCELTVYFGVPYETTIAAP